MLYGKATEMQIYLFEAESNALFPGIGGSRQRYHRVDYAKLTQEECAKKMQVSRPTVTRMYETVREKIADALVNGKQILIAGGDVLVCAALKPECAGETHCCHRQTGMEER